jgi:hypothetical protein
MNLHLLIAAPNTKLFILEICKSLESAAQLSLRFTQPEAIFYNIILEPICTVHQNPD